MFAGPNGSGKSRLKNEVKAKWLGVYLNADDLERELASTSCIKLRSYQIKDLELFASLIDYAGSSYPNLDMSLFKLDYKKGEVGINACAINSYYAAVLISAIREYLLRKKISFSFETVMSHPSKIEFLARAKEEGYRTYLYYVATEDPKININRVNIRVSEGGHNVPQDKIISRYKRSLELLKDAVKVVDRSFIFDNSGDIDEQLELAETVREEGELRLYLKCHEVPQWFAESMGLGN